MSIEERLKRQIGELVFQNIVMSHEIDALRAKLAEKDKGQDAPEGAARAADS